jgi:uncharacterized protein (TIGR02466 family)
MRTLDILIPFKTEIFVTILDPSITDGVLDQILKIQNSQQSTLVSNVGGWQSSSYKPKQQKFMTPIIIKIKEYIHEIYKTMDVDGSGEISDYWFNVNEKYDYNISHSHPGSYFSAALYLKTPQNSGNIVFERPDNLKETILFNTPNEHNFGDYQITPQENLLVIFPSCLHHYVARNNSDETRVSIAFNIK